MSKRVLKINAYVLNPNPVVEKNSKEGSSSKKAIGFLQQDMYRNAYVLSLTPIVENFHKEGSRSKKAMGLVVALESINTL